MNNKEFSERLKKRRQELGKTQQQIADKLDILRASYGEYERGNNTPPIDKLEKLAEALKTTPQYLCGWENLTDCEIIGGKRFYNSIYADIYNLKLSDTELKELFSFAKYLVFKRGQKQ